MEEAEIEDIIEWIRSVPFYQTSLPLLVEVEGVPVIGRPDCVVFDRGCPAFIYELKTFNAKTFRLHDDRKVQAMIYALLLEEMGFDCSRISLHVVGMRREIEEDIREELGVPLTELQRVLYMDPPNFFRAAREAICVPKDKLIRALREIPSGQGYPEKLAEMVYRGAISVFLIPYNREEALSRLRWAKAYWTNERKEPMSAQNPKKCETCVFADKCPSSLSPRPPHKVDG